MNPAGRVLKNTGILYARMAITVFISLYATRLLLNALGVVDFGIFNLVGGIISMLTFLNVAMASATQRFMSYAEGAGDFAKLRKIFNVSVVLHIVIAFLVVIILEAVGYFLFDGILTIPEQRIATAKLIYQFMIASTFFTIISVPYDAVINAHENMLLFAILSIIEVVLKLSMAIYVMNASGDKLIIYGALTALLAILLLLVRRIYCNRKYPECTINFKNNFDKTVFRDMTGFAGWSFLGASSSMLANYGQGVVLNMFFGTVVNAAQGIAGQVSGQLSSFAGTMQKALNPVIDKSEGGGDREMMIKASTLGSKISFFLLMLFFVPVIIEMPYIFKLWLKNVPQYAVIFCTFQLLRNLIDQVVVTLASSIAAVGNIKRFQLFSSILTFFPLLISFFLFKLGYPVYTLYVVFLIYAAMNAILTLYFAHVVCGLSISGYLSDVIFRCLSIFIGVITLSACPLLFMEPGIIRLVTVIAINGISFITSIWFFGFSRKEDEVIKIMVDKLLKKIKFKS